MHKGESQSISRKAPTHKDLLAIIINVSIKAGANFFFLLSGKLERRATEGGVKYATTSPSWFVKVHQDDFQFHNALGICTAMMISGKLRLKAGTAKSKMGVKRLAEVMQVPWKDRTRAQNQDSLSTLKLNPFFQALNPVALKKMLKTPSFGIEIYKKGDVLFKQGDATDGKLRIIHSGEVKGSVENKEGFVTRTFKIREGGCIGQLVKLKSTVSPKLGEASPTASPRCSPRQAKRKLIPKLTFDPTAVTKKAHPALTVADTHKRKAMKRENTAMHAQRRLVQHAYMQVRRCSSGKD
jgi:hypothetical protein